MNMKAFLKTLGILAFVGSSAMAQDVITRTYRSQPQWSGEGKAFSVWYTFKTPPAPAGYYVTHVSYELEGDRRCHSWGECRELPRDRKDWSVTVQYRMQGHDENFHPQIVSIGPDGVTFQANTRAATSLIAVTVTYERIK